MTAFDTTAYWNKRHSGRRMGSGDGSRGALGDYKAGIVASIIDELRIKSVTDYGCGEGLWLERLAGMLTREVSYYGFDVSESAVEQCRERLRGRCFVYFSVLTADSDIPVVVSDMAMSIDVIYHLVDDYEYAAYMRRLFASAWRYVLIYSSNEERKGGLPHMRPRRFTDWVDAHAREWTLERMIDNPHKPATLSDFYLYKKA